MGSLKKKKSRYQKKRQRQARGKFAPTSPFVAADHPDAAPLLIGRALQRAQDADERYLRWLLADFYRLWAARRPRV